MMIHKIPINYTFSNIEGNDYMQFHQSLGNIFTTVSDNITLFLKDSFISNNINDTYNNFLLVKSLIYSIKNTGSFKPYLDFLGYDLKSLDLNSEMFYDEKELEKISACNQFVSDFIVYSICELLNTDDIGDIGDASKIIKLPLFKFFNSSEELLEKLKNSGNYLKAFHNIAYKFNFLTSVIKSNLLPPKEVELIINNSDTSTAIKIIKDITSPTDQISLDTFFKNFINGGSTDDYTTLLRTLNITGIKNDFKDVFQNPNRDSLENLLNKINEKYNQRVNRQLIHHSPSLFVTSLLNFIKREILELGLINQNDKDAINFLNDVVNDNHSDFSTVINNIVNVFFDEVGNELLITEDEDIVSEISKRIRKEKLESFNRDRTALELEEMQLNLNHLDLLLKKDFPENPFKLGGK